MFKENLTGLRPGPMSPPEPMSPPRRRGSILQSWISPLGPSGPAFAGMTSNTNSYTLYLLRTQHGYENT